MGDSAPVALAMSAGVALAGGIAALTTLLGRHRQDRGPPLGSDLEYLLRRASALKQQQVAAAATAAAAMASSPAPTQGPAASGKAAAAAGGKAGASVSRLQQEGEQQQAAARAGHKAAAAVSAAAAGAPVTLEYLLAAMQETGAAGKLEARERTQGPNPAHPSMGLNGPNPMAGFPPAAPAPGPPAHAPAPAPAGLTKKDLEDTMKSMMGPPPGQGLQDGESALERFTTDLTLSARTGKLDPVIGRDDEIRRCIHILSRRTKNNPVLIGESGVGKTALVEGLAQRIVAGDVPMTLMGVKILELDLGSLTAGCMMPGEFEERLKAVLNEATQRVRVILFIDDIHNLVPAAGAAGATMMDGGALLKPALSRGELRIIGASSIDKYKKTIEKDPGLERRFQQIFVEQPSVEQTVSILRGLRPRYERYHGIDISEGALVAAAALSARYISGRFLPDKAIDLMDEATAQVKMEATLKPEAMDQLERQISQLKMESASLNSKASGDRMAASCLVDIKAKLKTADAAYTKLKAAYDAKQEQNGASHAKVASLASALMEIQRLQQEADEAEENGEIEEASEIRTHADRLQVELERKQMNVAASGMGGMGFPPGLHGVMRKGMLQQPLQEVLESDVAKVISRWTGIPVAKLVAGEKEKLLSLTDELHRRIIGQHEAVEAVAEAIQRSRADLADPNGPIASFMFLGPTGVGKTELAKALAAYLFNSDEALVRLDMSEYMEKHAVSRLIGAPPGYVGYDEGGLLTDAVRRRPYSVVLFDEIEKAHVDVFNVLLQVLDDGRVTDTQGHTVSFKNTVIIMTSNLGSAEIYDQLDAEEKASEGGGQALTDEARRSIVKQKVMEHVRTHFRPEFVNRVDDFITFEPLRPHQIKQIVVLRAQKLVVRLAERRIELRLEDSAVEHLARVGFDPVFGARPVKRALQRELQTLLAKAVLRGEFEEDDTVIVEASDPALTTKRAGDGNYSSGLVLRKGPRRQPEAEADESPNPTGTVKKDASEVACDSAAVPLHETPVMANGDHASTQDVEALQSAAVKDGSDA